MLQMSASENTERYRSFFSCVELLDHYCAICPVVNGLLVCQVLISTQ